MGQAHADGTRRKAASGELAAIRRGTWSSKTAVTVVTITTGVLIMMMFTTVGADVHGLTQRITRSWQRQWDRERDRTQMKPIFQTASDKVDAIDTFMQKVELFEIEVQEWQIVERDRAQQIKAKDDIKFVSEMGKLQQTMINSTERTGGTGDATRHARGEWHHSSTEAEGPQQRG